MEPSEDTNQTPEESRDISAARTASTGRRVFTAVLVLIAALLLGYVLYDVIF